jgi:hypothetical protein
LLLQLGEATLALLICFRAALSCQIAKQPKLLAGG